MTYDQALEFIHGTNKFGSKLGLDNIKTLLKHLGNPQKNLKFIHVAGTNGKGSTCAMLHEILKASHYKVGLYTSPFIETFEERIRICGENISKEDLAIYTSRVKDAIGEMLDSGLMHPTEFEVVTAIGMLYFKEKLCDVVVLEVGLGGRLDATNAIDLPLISVITPIDLDHVAYLGDTISKVAHEKAGIIKKGGLTIAHPQVKSAREVIEAKCEEEENELIWAPTEKATWLNSDFDQMTFSYEDEIYELGMIAPYQVQNAVVAIEAVRALNRMEAFKIKADAIKEGLRKTKWIGRMEVLSKSPLIIIDGAHNLHGIHGLVDTVALWGDDYEIMAVIGILEDKDVQGIVDAITPIIHQAIVTEPQIPRAMKANDLAELMQDISIYGVTKNIPLAIKKAMAWANKSPDKRMILCFGSLYMLGDIRKAVKNGS